MLNKQPVNINFAKGLDTKTDPKQVPVGNFLVLQNSIFTKAGLLQKRNGFGNLPALPNGTFNNLTTFNGNLTAIGKTLSAFSQSAETWIQKGTLQPLALSVLPTVRSATNQTQVDSALSPNGLICTVYSDVNGNTTTYKYIIADSTTGQNITGPSLIAPSAGVVATAPRVFVLGNYFIITFGALISTVNHLQYVAINVNNQTATTAVDVSTNFTPASTGNHDGVVANGGLFLAWNGNDGGGAIRMRRLSATLVLGNEDVVATGVVATVMSVTADTSTTVPVIWASFYNSGTSTGYVLAEQQTAGGALVSVLAATEIISSGSVANITATATAGVLSVFYEVNNTYGYDSTIATNYLVSNTVTQAGTVGTPTTILRSVGLASKAFMVGGATYFLAAYDGKGSASAAFQPTYFLINAAGGVIAKLAYSNGGGYLTTGLPGVSVSGQVAQVSYLYSDLIASVNKAQGLVNAAGIYSQTGINAVTFDFSAAATSTAEIGANLNISGGIVWAYDGQSAVEQNFNVWPDSVEGVGTAILGSMDAQQYFYQAIYQWTDLQGNIHQSAPSIPAGVNIGTTLMFLSTDVSIAVSPPASGSIQPALVPAFIPPTGTAVQLTTTGTLPYSLSTATTYYVIRESGFLFKLATTLANAQAGVYIHSTSAGSGTNTMTALVGVPQSGVQVNVPTLRLTYKTATPVKIVLYRWSTAQQSYYQVTSIASPLLNDPTIDYVTFNDTQNDSAIVGNSLIYTTGGVVEDIGPPATSIFTLYGSRQWLVKSEDPNLLWYSKQVIEGTPVEFSDLFTLYLPPTQGAQGNTGPITALSAMDGNLIVFKKDAIYYMTGIGPDNTGANADPGFGNFVFITSTVGCTNPNSIAFTDAGLMFQSDKGIWLLERNLTTRYIGAAVENFNSATVETALTIPGTTQVRFTLSSAVTLMYDYYYGQWGTFTNTPAVSSTLYQGLHTYIGTTGQVLQETPGVYLDGSNPVLMSFTTSWFNLAGLQGYERAYFFDLLGSFISPHKMVVQVAYDYNPAPTQQSIISPDNYNAPWGGDSTWGTSTPWGGTPALEQWKVHLQRQTCQSFQVTINEIFDSAYGVPAGAGFTLSGLDLVVGIKRGFRPIKAANSVG